MTRNLKAFGLALVAMFAMAAFASVAQAENKGTFTGEEKSTGENVTTFLTAEDEEGSELVFTNTASEQQVSCARNIFHGEIPGGSAGEVTVEPTFGGPLAEQECEAGGFPATVFNNGCHLNFYTAETVGAGAYSVLTDLESCEGPGIQVKAYLGGSHGFQVCEIVVPEQTEIEGVTATNIVYGPEEKDHDITLDVAVNEGIKEVQSGLCGGSEAMADFDGAVTVEGHNELLEAVDVRITD